MTKAIPNISRKIRVDTAEAELKLPWRMSSTTSWEMVAVGEFDDDEIDKHEKERAEELARHRREHESAERRRQRKEGRR